MKMTPELFGYIVAMVGLALVVVGISFILFK